MSQYDAIVVGAGPNGLAAAITLARTGRSVLVYEAKPTVGGGMRTQELTLPGFRHDICSAIQPLGMASPFFRDLPLASYGLEWIQPDLPLAHPLNDGTAAVQYRSVAETARGLGRDGAMYERLMSPLVENWAAVMEAFLGPLRPGALARHPRATVELGLRALWPADKFAYALFRHDPARALFAGNAAHSIMALDKLATSSIALMLMLLGHAVGWPLPKGGSQQIANAMAAYLRDLGGEIVTDTLVTSLDDLPSAPLVLLDITPQNLLDLMENTQSTALPARYRRQLESYRYGPGVFKADWALSEPIPWRAEACRRAGTVHVGGTLREIAAGERATYRGHHSDRPFILLAQQSHFDDTRAPAGQQTGWAYCHVPNGSTRDMTSIIEAQVERFAPGFRDVILARSTRNAVQMQAYSPNYIGGDINGGVQDLRQFFTRPVVSINPYRVPLTSTNGGTNRSVYLCSSSTPPGGGVHGMCGYFAARSVMREVA